MLELLATVDPMAALMGGLWLFAAGMFPVGFMLGSECSPCCGKCGCAEGSLPETITLSIDGFSNGQTPGPDLAALVFSSDFGSGAAGKVTSPGGEEGPISSIELTSGGDGYARPSRVEPTITASAPSGSGAVLIVALEQFIEERKFWRVSSVSVANGGTGYAGGSSVSFSVSGTGQAASPASAYITTGRSEPTVEVSASGSGSGASLSCTLSQGMDYEGNAVWSVASVSITDGGAGYQVGDEISASATDGQVSWYGYFYASVSGVDEDGAITGVDLYSGGEFFKDNGIIESVSIYGDGGVYYDESTSVPAETAEVRISVRQFGRTAATASGASLSAEIDTDFESDTFGQITSVTINNGGQNYLAYEWCEVYLDGVTEVLAKNGDCGWARQDCGRSFAVEYRGASTPALVTVSASGCTFQLEAESLISNCSEMSFVASDEHDRSVTVSTGGAPSVKTCNDCAGTITIGGADVRINGPYTLICVERFLDPRVANTARAFAWARATAFCGMPYDISGPSRIWVVVEVGMAGTINPFLTGAEIDLYDTINVGDEREDNWEFAGYQYTVNPGPRVLIFGPVGSQDCVIGDAVEYGDPEYGTASAEIPCTDELSPATGSRIETDVGCNV